MGREPYLQEMVGIFEVGDGEDKETVRVSAVRYKLGHFSITATDSKFQVRWQLRNPHGVDKGMRRHRFNTTLLLHYAKKFLVARRKRL